MQDYNLVIMESILMKKIGENLLSKMPDAQIKEGFQGWSDLRILFISKECAGISLAYKLAKETNEVKLYVQQNGFEKVSSDPLLLNVAYVS